MNKLFKIEAEIELYKEGRRTLPIITGYRPGFKFVGGRMTSGAITLLNSEELKPGEKGIVEIRFAIKDLLGEVNIGTEFIFNEGAAEIGKGIVTKIIGWTDNG